MRSRFFPGKRNKKEFDLFRDHYNFQLKTESDCESAFRKAMLDFQVRHGYEPYKSFEDYLTELFHYNNGFRLFNNLK